MPRDETAVAIEKQTAVLKEIAEGIAEANEIARTKLEQETEAKPDDQKPQNAAD
jgi:hypothetical protein